MSNNTFDIFDYYFIYYFYYKNFNLNIPRKMFPRKNIIFFFLFFIPQNAFLLHNAYAVNDVLKLIITLNADF